jgi:hypothetical protein
MTFSTKKHTITIDLEPPPALVLTDRPLRQPEMRLRETTAGSRLLLYAEGGWPRHTTIYLDDCILTLIAPTGGNGTWYTAVQLPNHMDRDRLTASARGDELLVEMPLRSEFTDEDSLREAMILPAA